MTETEIWVEKYRPTKFNDIVLSNINRNLFKNLIEFEYYFSVGIEICIIFLKSYAHYIYDIY